MYLVALIWLIWKWVNFFSILVHSKKVLKFHRIYKKIGLYTKCRVKKSVKYHELCCIITATAALPTIGHDLFIKFLIHPCHLFSLLCEIFQFEISISVIMGQIINGVMVTEIYPTLPPFCCHLDMFKKNSIFYFLNNSKRFQAVICYAKIYYSLNLLGCFRPGKAKNHFLVRANFYVDSEIGEISHCVLNEKKLTQKLCF